MRRISLLALVVAIVACGPAPPAPGDGEAGPAASASGVTGGEEQVAENLIEPLIPGTWELVAWGVDETVELERAITLAFEGDRAAGYGGCNRYFSIAVVGEEPGSLTFGPVGATQMYCEGPGMEAETRYLEALAGVHGHVVEPGRLTLLATVDGQEIALAFEPHEE
jgi:heat shock protein HslJ